MTKPVEGRLTAGFNDPRPLSNPGDHIHGAVDIAAPIRTIIKAPESGKVFCYVGIRPKEGMVWPRAFTLHKKVFPYNNYFYDMYGGIIVLQVFDNTGLNIIRTHVMAHTYGNQIFNKSAFKRFDKMWIEQAEDSRFPIHGTYTQVLIAAEGDPIGFVGNAGYSTGSHLHIECHHGYKWEKHEDRINLEELWDQ